MENKEVYAAIALALHEFNGNNVHDKEAGIITIKSKHTEWELHSLSMRNINKKSGDIKWSGCQNRRNPFLYSRHLLA